MFTADLFTTVQNWKEPKCPSTIEWMLYIHSVQYYSTIEKDKLLIHATP